VQHWKEGEQRKECKKIRKAAAAAKKKTVPNKKQEDDANDGERQTTTTSASSTSTSTTASSSPLPPQHDDESNATKSKTKESNDEGVDKKETTTTTTSCSTTAPSTSQSTPTYEADTCCVCLEDLPVNAGSFARFTCCGKAIHKHCGDNFFGSNLSQEQKSKCPHCQVKLETTKEESFERVRGWADKGKAWAQATLGDLYRDRIGVKQSYEKAIEYYKKAIQQRDPNAMFGLAYMYYQGRGVTKSSETAIELWTSAANQEHSGAQFNLGLMYAKGDGIDQSNELAREWWIKAAVQDHEDALQHLQRLDKQEGRTTPTILCCSTCGKPKTPLRPLKPCKLCHTVQYCGRECQVNLGKKEDIEEPARH
jgi:tetratricopeptide (TPR) repeat protein